MSLVPAHVMTEALTRPCVCANFEEYLCFPKTAALRIAATGYFAPWASTQNCAGLDAISDAASQHVQDECFLCKKNQAPQESAS